ncbi:autotransporter family protein [Yoonia sp. MH D7]
MSEAAGSFQSTGDFAYGILAQIENLSNYGNVSAIMNGGSIETTGYASGAIYAYNEGLGSATSEMSNGIISTTGLYSDGLYSNITNSGNLADATATLIDGDIATAGQTSSGVGAETIGFGNVTTRMDAGSISTSGKDSHGLLSLISNADSTAVARATLMTGEIVTAGEGSYGLYALNNGLGAALVQMDGGTVITTRTGSHGLFSEIKNVTSMATATAVLTAGEVKTTGDGSHAILVKHSGLGNIEVSTVGMGTILTTGAEAHGITTENLNADVDNIGTTTITIGNDITAGGDGINVRSASSGLVTITGNGNIAGGDDVGDDGIDVEAQGAVNIDVNGTITGDPGIVANSALGSIGIGGIGNVTGLIGNGIETNITGGAATADITIARDGIITGGDNGILATNAGSGDISITVNKAVNGGTGYGINTSTIAGANTVLTLNAGAAVGSAAGLGILNNVGDSTTVVNAGASVAGTVSLGDGSDTLVIATGADITGVTLLDGGDDTAVADTYIDALTLQGQTLSQTGTFLTNWENITVDGGSLDITDGDLTVGDDAGTGLVLTNAGVFNAGTALALTGNLATSAGGTFDGTGAGAGIYSVSGSVVNNGIITTQDDAVGDVITVSGDYTGTGTLLVDADFASDTFDKLVIEGNATGTTQLGVSDVTTGVATGNDIPIITVAGTSAASDFVLAGGPLAVGALDYDLEYEPGAFVLRSQGVNGTGAVYEALPAILGGFNHMSTLEQRVGQRQWALGDATTGDAQPSGSWVRLQGNSTNLEADTGTTSSIDTWGLQAGIDFNVEEGEAGHWVLGVTGQYGSSNASVANALGFGDIDSEGYGLGLTATWYGNNGTYFDAQGQVNWISSDLSSSTGGSLATDEDSTAYALSAEVGHRFKVSETGTWIPQAQLVWGQVDAGNFTDSAGNAVDLGSNDRFVGRLGLAYEADSLTAGGNSQKLYAIANIIHDFDASNSVDVAGATLTSDASQTWGEIGVGGSMAWDESKTLYGEVSYAQSFDSSDSDTFSASAGLRIQW